MESYERSFLNILSSALRGAQAQPGELSQEEWGKIFSLAREHNVLPMVCEAVSALPAMRELPAVAPLKQEVMQQVMKQAGRTMEFLELYRHLLGSGARPLVVKGIICRELYPNPDDRASGDEDLLIGEEGFQTFHQAMTEWGMAVCDPDVDVQTAFEVPYRKKGSPVYIEAHKYLFSPENTAYGDMNRFFEGVFDRAAQVRIQGQLIWTMAPTDHMFYLICHAFKHFLHGGFGIRQVCDIVMFARQYGERIDWELVLGNCRQIRAEAFTAALLRIGREELGFGWEELHCPECWQEIEVDAEPMLEDLLRAGIFGGTDMSRKHSSTITLNAVADQKQGKKARGGFLRSVFPPAKAMEKQYPYLKKNPWLLPAAWTSRILRYSKEVRNSNDGGAAEAVKTGRERVELLRFYHVLDD